MKRKLNKKFMPILTPGEKALAYQRTMYIIERCESLTPTQIALYAYITAMDDAKEVWPKTQS